MFGKSKHSKHSNNDNSLYPDIDIINSTPSLIGTGERRAPHALTADEVLGSAPKKPTADIPMQNGRAVSPLEALRQRAISAANEKAEEEKRRKAAEEKQRKAEAERRAERTAQPEGTVKFEAAHKKENTGASLFEKCLPYISENGKPILEEKPQYKLESIDDIINASENKAARLLEQLNNMGAVTYDSLSRTSAPSKEKPLDEPIAETPAVAVEEIKTVLDSPESLGTISDIDNSSFETRTITFDKITDQDHIYEDIVSSTKQLDISEEIFDATPNASKDITIDTAFTPAEFKVEKDYLGYSDAKEIGTRLLKKSRAAGIRLTLTTLLFIALGVLRLPFIHDKLFAAQSFFGTIALSIFAVICLINYDAFAKIGSLFSPRRRCEAGAAITAVATVIYSLQALSSKSNPYHMILFATAVFFAKCVAVSMRNNCILNNFRLIANKKEKLAIKFINDRQITFAMAKNNIEGDALIGAANSCSNVQEFLKYTLQDSAMNGILGSFTCTALILSLLGATVYGIYTSSLAAFCSVFAVLVGFAFSPTVFFTDILPISRANSKLRQRGAMIAGAEVAKQIELANAVAVKTIDLFPAGTVTLHSMQPISPNDIDKTLLDAAAIAKQSDSPLFDIFDKIAATQGAEIPIADSIKYEERLGISGWVDNRHIFIGNRTLLEAHGIKVPSIEVDKSILRNNLFPVYVASDEQPCAILAVNYNVADSICDEVRSLTASGVMILVDSSDPNINGEMICDYFGLFPGAAYVMGSSGSQLYKNATKHEDCISAGAAYKTHSLSGSIFSIFNAAAKIKRSITRLTVFHIISAILMATIYVYSSYINGFSPLESGTIFIYMVLSLAISYIISLFNK